MGQGNKWSQASHSVGQYSFPVNVKLAVFLL